ncbi:ABC transporter permease (plasmid) [Deinococcus metallilatus]|uniref:ABC transporter permease n=1 Tax=Deinococcus metallilatus TaxID=1211322 RepID=A0AAJ5JZZ2_9DEIO|nr:ABC transporter permease [Deinococcus metallilatus]MBB5295695.1 peptide/nickel transport system permease protein [Deinococcus metallilatus]QBY06855.1 ABC transporter permease [Deinococcus metallilatus]TLK32244.1 ABC transporter permease [Deinococcus metallilatus]GMA14227.1 ABC transporter permease [Deinococcus metallilatus]
MIQFAIRRLFAALPTLLVVTVLVFGMVQLLPGDPARLLLGEEATPQAVTELRHSLGLDRPVPEQYARWLVNIGQLDFGTSVKDNSSVLGLIADKLPTTIELALFAMLIAALIALPAGMISALHRDSWTDRAFTLFALSGISLPNFFLGILLIYIFSIRLAWIPASGYVPFTQDPAKNLLLLLLPAVTLGVHSAAVLARYLRSSMLETLSQDYVRTAHAKGITRQRVVLKHGLRNALVPVITAFGLQLGGLLGGAVITEQIFSVPGFGRLLVDAVFTRDLPVIQGVVLVSAVAVFLVSFLVDLTYAAVDPRIRYH